MLYRASSTCTPSPRSRWISWGIHTVKENPVLKTPYDFHHVSRFERDEDRVCKAGTFVDSPHPSGMTDYLENPSACR